MITADINRHRRRRTPWKMRRPSRLEHEPGPGAKLGSCRRELISFSSRPRCDRCDTSACRPRPGATPSCPRHGCFCSTHLRLPLSHFSSNLGGSINGRPPRSGIRPSKSISLDAEPGPILYFRFFAPARSVRLRGCQSRNGTEAITAYGGKGAIKQLQCESDRL